LCPKYAYKGDMKGLLNLKIPPIFASFENLEMGVSEKGGDLRSLGYFDIL
jgi:hypothetical protein